MRIAESFSLARPPEAVFDYVSDPSKLADWQTSKTLVEPLDEGPPGPGTPAPPRRGSAAGPMRLLGPVVARAMARQFAGYHRILRRNLEEG